MEWWNWWRFTISWFDDFRFGIVLLIAPTVELLVTVGHYELEIDIWP